MSQEERDRLEWLKRAKDGVISQRQAARRMGVTDRWVRKLLKRMKRQGDRVVVHGLRGRVSNRKIASQVHAQAVEFLKQPDWHDFGPTFASEQLAKRHGIAVSDETLRGWMIEAGLWKPGARRIEEAHCWRPRPSAFGELVQWDTSEHDWLEGRGPVRYLVRLIDDATSWSYAPPVRSMGCRSDPQQQRVNYQGGAISWVPERIAEPPSDSHPPACSVVASPVVLRALPFSALRRL